jgi:hypothetical protein
MDSFPMDMVACALGHAAPLGLDMPTPTTIYKHVAPLALERAKPPRRRTQSGQRNSNLCASRAYGLFGGFALCVTVRFNSSTA